MTTMHFKDRTDAILYFGGFLTAIVFTIDLFRALRTGDSGATSHIPAYQRATQPIGFYGVLAFKLALVIIAVIYVTDRTLNGA